jgi:hypothetical protein
MLHCHHTDQREFKRARFDIPQTPQQASFDEKSFRHSPPKTHQTIEESIDAFFDARRPRMEKLVAKAGDVWSLMSLWTPGMSDKILSDHVSKLRIPMTQDGRPSFLLHNLGEEETYDRVTSGFINNIFDPFVPSCVINPSKNVSTTNALFFF